VDAMHSACYKKNIFSDDAFTLAEAVKILYAKNISPIINDNVYPASANCC
jgi:hypothetical protein